MSNNSRMILSAVIFSTGSPCLVLDQLKDNHVRRIQYPVLNKSFTLTALPGNYCIGRFELSTFESFPCPRAAVLTDKKAKICYECFTYNSFNPSFYNVPVTSLSTKQRVYNSQPHVVYLAAFGEKTVKVGISHAQRVVDRWCEQGALAAAIIARTENAYAAREIENEISKTAKLPETLKKDFKRELLKKEVSFAIISKAIRSVFEQISAHNAALSLETITDLNLGYFGNLSISSLIDFPDQSVHLISGRCRGVIGDTILMENNGRLMSASLSNFIGHAVQIDEKVIPVEVQGVQSSLF